MLRFPSMTAVLAALSSLIMSSSDAAPTPEPALDEAVEIFRRYLRIDTTNPPGNEMAAARFLKEILDREGLETWLFDLGEGRANLMARLRGDGTGRPVILLHHMDVVPADPRHWTVPPFEARLADGWIYGRGALDIKAKGIVDLMTLLALKREGTPLSRDILFLAVADEEEGSLGSRWMTREKKDLIGEAEILLDEGGTIFEDPPGSRPWYMVSIAEKTPLWLSLRFSGPAGHGSVPLPDSAVHRLLRAAGRLLDASEPLIFLPGLVEHLAQLLQTEDLTGYPGFTGDIGTSLREPTFLEAITRIPRVNAALRNTMTITRLEGSDKVNSISNTATMEIDCRLMPGIEPMMFLDRVREQVADDRVEVTVLEVPEVAPPPSPVDSPFFGALRAVAARHDPDPRIVPHVLTSSTDAVFYRALGIAVYGFESYRVTWEDYDRSHGNDERFSVDSLAWGLRFHRELLLELCGRKSPGPSSGESAGTTPSLASPPAAPPAAPPASAGPPIPRPTPPPPPAPLPGDVRRWITGIPDVFQVTPYACGAAVFQAIVNRHGQRIRQRDAMTRLGTDPDLGTHPTRIVAGLEALGIEATFSTGMTVAELRGHVDRGDLVVLDFQAWGDPPFKDYATEWEDGHYAIVLGYGEGHVYLEDPSILGSIGYLTWGDLDRRWHDYEVEQGQRREYRHAAIVVPGGGGGSARPRIIPVE